MRCSASRRLGLHVARPENNTQTNGNVALRICEGDRLPEGWVRVPVSPRDRPSNRWHCRRGDLQHTGRGCRENVFQYLERLFGNLRNRLHWSNKPAMYIGECWLPRCRSQSVVKSKSASRTNQHDANLSEPNSSKLCLQL